MDKFWKAVYIVLFASLGVLVITHPKSSATVFGSLFSGINGISTTLTGVSNKTG
jgi:hypothetical protein